MIFIKRDSKEPLYMQIYVQIKNEILNGMINVGEVLAGSRSLAKTLGVSRNTVDNAYSQLSMEGYIAPKRGIGYTVLEVPALPKSFRTHKMNISVQQLDKSKIQVYLDILLERAHWLESINQQMWNIANLNPINFEKMYPDYAPYLIYLGDQIIGGFVLLNHDRFLWSEEENNQTAFYIHKLVIKQEFAGRGYAQKSISLIKNIALLEGKSFLRLDCYGDRAYLMKLYEDCGFYGKRKTVMDDGTALQSYELILSK